MKSYVGPQQFQHLKAETGAPYVWVDYRVATCSWWRSFAVSPP